MLPVIHFNHTPKPLSNPSFEHYSNDKVKKIAKKTTKTVPDKAKLLVLQLKITDTRGTATSSPPLNDASVVGSHYATASKCALRVEL